MKKILPFLFLTTIVSAQDANFKKLMESGDSKYTTKSYKAAYTDYEAALKLVSADIDKMVAAKQQVKPEQKPWLNCLEKHARSAYYSSNLAQAYSDADKILIIDSVNTDAKALKNYAVVKAGNKVDGCVGLGIESAKGKGLASAMHEDCFCWAEGVGQHREAKSAFSLAKNEEALGFINKAIDILPDSLNYYILKGEILGKMNNLKEAVILYTKVINKDSSNFKAWYLRGLANLAFEKPEMAFSDLSACIKLNSFSYDAYYTRAEICQTLKEYQSAIYDYQQCIRMKPENAELHYKIAIIKKDDIQDDLGGCAEFIKAAAMGYEEAIPYAEDCKNPKKDKKKK